MSVKEVPMFRVECDKCGEGNDGEYWAWSDKSHAVEEWQESDDFALNDGRAYHRDCAPAEVCPLGDRGEHRHTFDSASPGLCAECEQAVPVTDDTPEGTQ